MTKQTIRRYGEFEFSFYTSKGGQALSVHRVFRSGGDELLCIVRGEEAVALRRYYGLDKTPGDTLRPEDVIDGAIKHDRKNKIEWGLA